MTVYISVYSPDSKVHGANMGPTWVLSSPGGPYVGPMNLAVWVVLRHMETLGAYHYTRLFLSIWSTL